MRWMGIANFRFEEHRSVNPRGDADGFKGPVRYRLQPNRLPDTGRAGVKDADRIHFPMLLAAGNVSVGGGVFCANHDPVVLR